MIGRPLLRVPRFEQKLPSVCRSELLHRTIHSLLVGTGSVKNFLLRCIKIAFGTGFGCFTPRQPKRPIIERATAGDTVSGTPRIIRKYPNRRLYDVANDGYITLANVKALVLQNVDLEVVDAKSGEDLTRTVLLQIILDAELGATPMLSADTLAEIVRLHGAAQQGMAGAYMEESVKAFLAIQQQIEAQALPAGADKSLLTPELWKQLVQMQAPAIQGMLGEFLEQSARRFMAGR